MWIILSLLTVARTYLAFLAISQTHSWWVFDLTRAVLGHWFCSQFLFAKFVGATKGWMVSVASGFYLCSLCMMCHLAVHSRWGQEFKHLRVLFMSEERVEWERDRQIGAVSAVMCTGLLW